MIEVIVNIKKDEDVETSAKISISEMGEAIFCQDIIPSIKAGTKDLKTNTDAEVLVELINNLLKGFVRQQANLW